MRLLILLALSAFSLSANVATVAGALSIAASSGTIVKEAHDLIRHPVRTFRRHGRQLKDAARGKK